MDSAFDNLDAAGFLEIWQHFDADGEDSWLYFLSFYIFMNTSKAGVRALYYPIFR